MDKQKVIEVIHNLGGCDASDEWSKGYDAGITAALEAIEKIPDTDIRRGKYVPNKGNFCSECGADMRGEIKT